MPTPTDIKDRHGSIHVRSGFECHRPRRPVGRPASGDHMELSFRTRTLRSVCEDEAKAVAAYGERVAAQLRLRVADLRAAPSVADLPPIVTSLASGEEAGLRVAVSSEYVLRCRSSHRADAHDPEGAVDWRRVHRLQLLDIEEEQ
jgi:hypothetical protein